VFIEHSPENSMASFNFSSTVLDEGTTFILNSWICVANSLGGFNSHLATLGSRRSLHRLEAVISTSSSTTSMSYCFLIWPCRLKRCPLFDATSTRDALELVGSDSNRSEGTTQSKYLSDLEEHLDLLLKLKDVGATACRGPPFSITTRTPMKSTYQSILHLQASHEEDSEMREPLPVGRPLLLKTTRNSMATQNRFWVAIWA
jgi:hypothetical protein